MHVYKRCYFMFVTGGTGYCLLELIWRGYTHPSMGVLGGLCLIMIYYINYFFQDRSPITRAFLSGFAITVSELFAGILLNIIMKLNIWDYSDMPLHILGQICPFYSVLWVLLSLGMIFLFDNMKGRHIFG